MDSPAVVFIKHTSGYIEMSRIISSVAIDTRTSILHLSFNKKSFLCPANSYSICSGHFSLFFANALVGHTLEQAYRYRLPFSRAT